MKSHQTTIVDIARQLKISKSTVSRALTGHPNVKAETRVLVQDLAEKLDYQRNILSISLITNKTKTIGIIVPEFMTSYFPQVVVGAQEEAAKAGYNVIVSQCNETYETEVANSKVMLASRVDGILVSLSKETRNFDHWKIFQRKGIPIVFFNRVCDEMMVPKVVVNDYDAAYKAVEHLIHTGKKRIAHLAGPNCLSISRKRLEGYLDALRNNNYPIDEELIISYDLTLSKVRIYIKHLLELESPPDGLFAINDPTAIEAIQVIKNLGRRIPEDIAVVGFSNNYASSFIEPSLTTVSQPVKEMGRTAMQLLFGLMDKEVSQWKPIIKILEAELIIRNSTVKTS
ncbi:LacI family DNA-binding transcriptional regulator [Arcticibacter tournemirensis]|uniref:LacI family transcriptional regulator n=1 Tax=Arcticibacter tournemirensis TaxID=699437 RepID=A0A4Q0M2N6_9SPHI|nr:LacI family DNA-binding transcriptional regulator [Arcticibacter tournemirensis]RXF67148.1 LacI family transcriptional regulator [Arcticibacter tournemirensis]